MSMTRIIPSGLVPWSGRVLCTLLLSCFMVGCDGSGSPSPNQSSSATPPSTNVPSTTPSTTPSASTPSTPSTEGDSSSSSGDSVAVEMSGALTTRGVDLSMLEAVEQAGGTFQQNGVTQDLFALLQAQGVNLVRLRLWVDPKSATGVAYGGGDSDLARVTRLAKRAKAAKMRFLLDLHYSDFWSDPSKQFKPKAWQALSDDALVAQVKAYTQQVVAELIAQGVAPEYVQVGNEINSGLLWPTGKNWGEGSGGFDMLAKLLNGGIEGVRAAETAAARVNGAKIILHLAKGGDNGTFRWWFDEITKRNVPFDIMGISYYPYWHGALSGLQYNMNDMVSRYGKPVMIVETAYAFTTDNADSLGNGFGPNEVTSGGYPATPAGQLSFLQDLRGALKAVPNQMGLGFVYWEPDWLPVDATWASDAGMSYLQTTGNVGNAWENQALFDFHGDALPALAAFAAP